MNINVRKSDLIAEEMIGKIKKGEMGKSGERFLSTRALSKQYQTSLDTAQQVMNLLKEQQLIQLIGKIYYLTYDLFEKTAQINHKISYKKQIGVHLFDFDPYTARIAKSIEYYGRKYGYQVMTASSSFQLEREQEILNMFRDNQVSGVITCTINKEGVGKIYESFPLPILYYGTKPDGIIGNKVFGDEFLAGMDLAEHLLSEGYEDFAFVGISKWVKAPRFLGAISKLGERGIEIPEEKIIILRDKTQDLTGKLRQLVFNQKKPIALICFSDDIAINALKFCRLYQYKVPDQIGISGFDDSLEAEFSGITSIRVNVDRMAEQAVKLLIDQIESGERRNTTYSVNGLLKIRDSTKLKNLFIEKR